jgi:hypothetical protein
LHGARVTYLSAAHRPRAAARDIATWSIPFSWPRRRRRGGGHHWHQAHGAKHRADGGGWSHDAFCISAGPNGQYETPFGGNATHGVYRRGDDLIFIISAIR